MSDNTKNCIHASIHESDKDIGNDKKPEKKSNAIHASIRPDDKTGQEREGGDKTSWIKKILTKKK
jgi:hypothetical protein